MSIENDLQRAGLRHTHPRMTVLSIMGNSEMRHMSAEDIYKVAIDQGETIGLATIYRALTQFESAGLIIRHQFEPDKSVYELNDDEHHDHLICIQCNKVVEFYDEEIERLQQKIADKHGFTLEDHSLTLYGVCKNCPYKTNI